MNQPKFLSLSAKSTVEGTVIFPPAIPKRNDANACPMGAAAALLRGPTVYAVVALKLRGVAELVGETPKRFSGLKRNSPPNLIWCVPLILYTVAPALRVSVFLYS